MIRVGIRYYDLALGPAPLPRACANCGRGEGHATRTWEAPTLMGVPLFVLRDACTYKCAWCGTEQVGPPPRGAAPLPVRQRFGVAILGAVLLGLYGVWFVGDAAVSAFDHYRYRAREAREQPERDRRAAEAATEARLTAARADATKALAEAEESQKRCERAIAAVDPKRIADVPFWKRTPIATAPSRALAKTPYYGFASLAHERENAAALGGFACLVDGALGLKAALESSGSTAASLEPLTARVRAASASHAPPPVVVVSAGGCKTDRHWCRVAFLWVDLPTKAVVAEAFEEAPWVGEDQNEPGTDAARERLLRKVAGWGALAGP